MLFQVTAAGRPTALSSNYMTKQKTD